MGGDLFTGIKTAGVFVGVQHFFSINGKNGFKTDIPPFYPVKIGRPQNVVLDNAGELSVNPLVGEIHTWLTITSYLGFHVSVGSICSLFTSQ